MCVNILFTCIVEDVKENPMAPAAAAAWTYSHSLTGSSFFIGNAGRLRHTWNAAVVVEGGGHYLLRERERQGTSTCDARRVLGACGHEEEMISKCLNNRVVPDWVLELRVVQSYNHRVLPS